MRNNTGAYCTSESQDMLESLPAVTGLTGFEENVALNPVARSVLRGGKSPFVATLEREKAGKGRKRGNEKSPVSQKEPSLWSRVPSGSHGGRDCYASNTTWMARALKMSG